MHCWCARLAKWSDEQKGCIALELVKQRAPELSMILVVTRWPLQTPANPSNMIVGRRRVGGVLGEGWETWFVVISLTHCVGTLPLKTAEDASSSGENG
jgi:hypothetical protein